MTDAPQCPGCHFGCRLDAYQCARGKGFHENWKEGEEIPQRGHGPAGPAGSGGPGGPGGKPAGGPARGPHGPEAGPAMPVEMRTMHALNIMGNVLQDRHAESAERKVLASVARQGGFFSEALLPKRAFIEREQAEKAVDLLVAERLLERATDDIAGAIVRITEQGESRQAEWKASQEAAAVDFLSPLSQEEQTNLANLLFKILKGDSL